MDPRNRLLDGVDIPQQEGAILGVVWPIEKHWESLLVYAVIRDHSVVDDDVQLKGSFSPQ